MDKLDVLYIFDDAYAGIAGVSLTSLFENNSAEQLKITAYLFLVQVSDENRLKFKKMAEKYHQTIQMIDADLLMEEILKLGISSYRGSIMTNLRLHFDKFIPTDVQRLLYLDCDTIICGSLAEITSFNMQGKLLGMSLDAYGKILSQTLSQNEPYFNAGVLLIDYNKWRNENWQEKIDSYILENNSQFNHPDQDVFNIVCKNDIVRLPIQFNFQTVHRRYSDKLYNRYLAKTDYYCTDEIDNARNNPCIIHMVRFLGINPWNKKNQHPDYELFSRYENISLWKNQNRISTKTDILLRTEEMLYKILPDHLFFPISVWAINMILTMTRNGKY